jgi:carbamate kinase
MRKLAVVAFGGNALLQSGQKGTIGEQEKNAYETSEKLLVLIRDKNYQLVITHGNGPQVGNLLLNNTAGNKM